MTRAWAIRAAAALAVIGIMVTAASADEGGAHLSAQLSGFSESPPNLTAGTGSFHATVQGNSLTYTLKFSNLSSTATQSHIHFGIKGGVSGGIVIWLCQSATNPAPAGDVTPTCPAAGGTVTGTVTAANVVALPGQGVAAGDFAGVLRIIRVGEGYVNVHTTNHPAGEIRGQIQVGG